MKFSHLTPLLILSAGFIAFISSNSLMAQSTLIDSTGVKRPDTSAQVLCPRLYLNGSLVGKNPTEIPNLKGSCYDITATTFTSAYFTTTLVGAPVGITPRYRVSDPDPCQEGEYIHHVKLNADAGLGSFWHWLTVTCCKTSLTAQVSYEYTAPDKCPQ